MLEVYSFPTATESMEMGHLILMHGALGNRGNAVKAAWKYHVVWSPGPRARHSKKLVWINFSWKRPANNAEQYLELGICGEKIRDYLDMGIR